MTDSTPTPSESSSPFHPPVGAWRIWLPRIPSELLILLALVLTFVTYPASPGVDLNHSAAQVLNHAVDHDIHFGSDYITTAGPLGYLLEPTNNGRHAVLHRHWQIVTSLVFALIIWSLSLGYRGVVRGVILGFFFMLVGTEPATLMLQVGFIVLLAYVRWASDRHWSWALVLAAGLTFASLLQFSLMLLSVATVLIIGLQQLKRGHRSTALALVIAFGVSLPLAWMGCGQTFGGLLLYFARAGQLHLAQQAAAAEPLIPSLVILSLLSLSGLIWYCAQWWRSSVDRNLDTVLLLLVALPALVQWKMGVVRPDSFAAPYFLFQLFLVVLLPLLRTKSHGSSFSSRIGLCVTASTAFMGLWVAEPRAINQALFSWNMNLRSTFDRLNDTSRWDGELQHGINHGRGLYTLPQIKSQVGEASVDVMGYEVGYAPLNQFNYTPRPVPQSNLVTTPGLAQINADWITSEQGPQYVLQKLQTVDQRLPALDDSRATLALYQNYELQGQLRRFLVWQKTPPAGPAPPAVLIGESAINWGESVRVPDHGEAPIWCEIEVTPSWWGRLRQWFLPLPALRIHIVDQGGTAMAFHFVPGSGQSGFLAAPHFLAHHDIMKFQSQGTAAQRIESIRLTSSSAKNHGYRDDIKIRFFHVAPLSRNSEIAPPDTSHTFRSFSDLPTRYEAMYAIAELTEHDEPVVAAHPPSVIEFNRPETATHIAGGFAFFLTALTNEEITDGVDFMVEWVGPDGFTQILLARTLKPRDRFSDQGLQRFDLALPQGPGVVRLRTMPGPAYDLSCDWVYWKNIKFHTP